MPQKHCYESVSSGRPKFSCQKNKKLTDSITDYKKYKKISVICVICVICGPLFLLNLKHPMFHGKYNRLGAIIDAKFFKNITDMGFYGIFTDI